MEIIKEQCGHCRKSSGKRKGQIEAANGGKFELYQDVYNQENLSFHLWATIQVFIPGLVINSPNCFTFI